MRNHLHGILATGCNYSTMPLNVGDFSKHVTSLKMATEISCDFTTLWRKIRYTQGCIYFTALTTCFCSRYITHPYVVPNWKYIMQAFHFILFFCCFDFWLITKDNSVYRSSPWPRGIRVPFQYKYGLCMYEISIIKIRRSWDSPSVRPSEDKIVSALYLPQY